MSDNTTRYAYLVYNHAPYGSDDVSVASLDLNKAKRYAKQRTHAELNAWIEDPAGRDWITESPWLFEWQHDEDDETWRYVMWQKRDRDREDSQCWFLVRRVELLSKVTR